jgi:hypothetical protein
MTKGASQAHESSAPNTADTGKPLKAGTVMTSPCEEITVQCPQCKNHYKDWLRASINLDLDEEFDDEYLDAASSATCPQCKHKVYFNNLIVKDGVFILGSKGKAQKRKK